MSMIARRPITVVVLGAGLLIGLTACADDDGASPSLPTVTIRPSSYVVRPPVTTPSSDPPPITANEEGFTDQVQYYIVQSGDFPSEIAARYEVDLDALLAFNDWELVDGMAQGFPGAGTEIGIPPPSKLLEPDETEETDPPDTSATDNPDPPAQTDPPDSQAGRCDPGTYTVEANDYPIGVAEKLDVSLEALVQANGWTLDAATGFYTGFPSPGGTIIVPPPDDC